MRWLLATWREPAARRRLAVWALWIAVLLAATGFMLVWRAQFGKAHVTLVLLLVVLGGSASGGRALGLTLAAAGFLLFDFLFLPPFYTVIVANPLDWLVLVAYLLTSVVATQLLDRAQTRAEEARQRAVEVERLAMLGAETLNAGLAEDALSGMAEMIRAALGVACCEMLVLNGEPPRLELMARAGTRLESDGTATAAAHARATAQGTESLAAWVAARGAGAAERGDRTATVASADARGGFTAWHLGGDVRVLLVPLRVRNRTVGVLQLSGERAITLDPAQRQFLSALTYYAALGVERVRLVADAERAEAFRQADALKTALLATVSHDLRTPLTAIKALAHDIAERDDGGARERAASIEEEADRLNRTVADLLDFSRLTAGAMPMHLELNSADDLVGAVLRRVAGVARGRAVRVTRPATAPLLFGTFDSVHAVRALGNLVENALKYSPPESAVELSIDRAGEVLVFAVADRGPGVPPTEKDRIFEPFYRAAARETRMPPDVGGAGLGLAIARALALAQNGALGHRPRPGGGSIFHLELPAADPPDSLPEPDVPGG